MNNKYILGSVLKSTKVVDYIATNPGENLTTISEATGINKSTCFKILYTLEEAGWIHKTEHAEYRLSLKFIYFTEQADRQATYKEQLDPILEKIVDKFNESCHVGSLVDCEHVMVVAKKSGQNTMQMTSLVGREMPAYGTAMGKALIAFQNQEKINDFYKNYDFKSFTKNTIDNYEDFLFELKEIKKNGYSMDNEETEIGLTCISVPVVDKNGKAFLSISVSGPTQRILSEKEEIIEELKYHAKHLSMFINSESYTDYF